MKHYRTISLLAIAIIISLSSCHSRGDYLCACAGGFTGHYYKEIEVSGKSKKDAGKKCEAMGDPVGTADGIGCMLKK